MANLRDDVNYESSSSFSEASSSYTTPQIKEIRKIDASNSKIYRQRNIERINQRKQKVISINQVHLITSNLIKFKPLPCNVDL